MRETTRLIVVEDDPTTRQALLESLRQEPSFDVVADCATLAEGETAVTGKRAEVMLTDINLPDGQGFDLIRTARRLRPAMEVMVISVLGDETSVVTAIEAGAAGFLLKDARSLDIVQSVKDLLDGRSPISTSVARHIVRTVQERKADYSHLELLTEREMDILWGIAKGFTYNDVADKLAISHNTVPTHIKNIYRKLEVNSRGEAVFEAIQRGLINIS